MNKYFFEHWNVLNAQTHDSLELDITLCSEFMPFMRDHFFAGKCLIPGAVLADMMLEGCSMLDPEEDIFPLNLKNLDIRRAVHVFEKERYTIRVNVRKIENNDSGRHYACEIRGALRNSKGEVKRKNVVICSAEFALGLDSKQGKEIVPPKEQHRYDMTKAKLYEYFINTHGPLFQTLNGKLLLSPAKDQVESQFQIGDREQSFSEIKNLPFILSPLGFDSILQTAVTFSMLNVPGQQDYFYTKLPVQVRNFRMDKPFEGDASYRCRAKVVEHNDDTMTLEANLHLNNGDFVGSIGELILKKAPFERYSRSGTESIIEKYREKSGPAAAA
ncbi:MAG: hypothetical protein HOK97_15635 [Deltaproteobacteria bacterium]|jgi:hypothetical protein|nr:hypothetical protein [Deltaproteobacteria bacterium]MBT6491203.1 hypothetical protein [Deltaproteobacteria bacterium]